VSSCAGGLEFKFPAGQMLHSVANDAPSFRHLCN